MLFGLPRILGVRSGTVSLLALLPLLIVATDIYGMLSYLVVERTSEIGIRRPPLACHSAPATSARRAMKVDPLVALRNE